MINEREAAVVLSTMAADAPAVRSMVWAMGAQGALARLSESPDLAEDLTVDPSVLIKRAASSGVRFVMPGDLEYPARLRELAVHDPSEAPVGLWVRGTGDLEELTRRAVSVTGTRSATAYGLEVASQVAGALARAGVTVISGGAYGVDSAAHRGALAAGGPSIAVLPGGADRAYPAAHADLLEAIAAGGAVVSETAPGSAPTRARSVGRARLIAALSDGTVVTEAAMRSGALAVAEWARTLGHPLQAVPGPITSVTSAGVNELLRRHAAELLLDPADALELAGVPASA